MSKTLFEKIATHEIPAQIVYEDDLVVAFRDINPGAGPCIDCVEKPIPRIAAAEASDQPALGHVLARLLPNSGWNGPAIV